VLCDFKYTYNDEQNISMRVWQGGNVAQGRKRKCV